MIVGTIDWSQIWQTVVWAAIFSYFGLGVAITIGGFFDVIKMFRRLEDDHAASIEASRVVKSLDGREGKQV